MAKRYSMPTRLRKYRNIIATIGLLSFVGACVGGPGAFDSATNELIGKNVDIFVLGPGYFLHPRTGIYMYVNNKQATVIRETSDEITYEKNIASCIYALKIDKKTRLLKSWYFVHEDRKYWTPPESR